jgi:uncharacterized protein (DUF952 family)
MIFHIAQQTDFAKLAETGFYSVDSLALEGFIHCSRKSQVHATGQRYFMGRKDLLLLTIDPQKLTVPLRYEEATNHELFPHIYGKINKEAIINDERIIF